MTDTHLDARRPRVLIAAPGDVIRLLKSVLSDEAEIVGAQAHDEAIRLLHVEEPDLIIVCYAFDEMHPFRFLRYVREERELHVPTILVRALPVPLGKTQEAEIRESYRTLGVDEFFNLYELEQRHGRTAGLQKFRDSVLNRLPLNVSDVNGASLARPRGPQ